MDMPITTPYEPNDELRELLSEVRTGATIDYGTEQTFKVAGHPATQRQYEVAFDEFELEATETESAVGMMVSFEGHLGLAAATLLANALVYGEPTQTYVDDAPPQDGSFGDRYQDLTGEWYVEAAVDAGLPEARLDQRSEQFDADLLDVDELERYARIWLSADGD